MKGGLALARQNWSELILVHVIPFPSPLVAEGYVSPKTYAAVEVVLFDWSHEVIKRVRRI